MPHRMCDYTNENAAQNISILWRRKIHTHVTEIRSCSALRQESLWSIWIRKAINQACPHPLRVWEDTLPGVRSQAERLDMRSEIRLPDQRPSVQRRLCDLHVQHFRTYTSGVQSPDENTCLERHLRGLENLQNTIMFESDLDQCRVNVSHVQYSTESESFGVTPHSIESQFESHTLQH